MRRDAMRCHDKSPSLLHKLDIIFQAVLLHDTSSLHSDGPSKSSRATPSGVAWSMISIGLLCLVCDNPSCLRSNIIVQVVVDDARYFDYFDYFDLEDLLDLVDNRELLPSSATWMITSGFDACFVLIP